MCMHWQNNNQCVRGLQLQYHKLLRHVWPDVSIFMPPSASHRFKILPSLCFLSALLPTSSEVLDTLSDYRMAVLDDSKRKESVTVKLSW